MPPRTYRLSGLIARFVLLSFAAVALAVLRPAKQANARVQQPRRRRSGVRRVAISLSFATLFFAGASFSAGAGDMMVQLVEGEAQTAVADQSQEAATSEASTCESTKRSDWDAEDGSSCAEEPTADATTDPAAGEPAATDPAATDAPAAAPDASAPEATAPATEPATSPEAEAPAAAALVEQTAHEVAVVNATPGRSARPSLKTAVKTQARQARPRSRAKGNDGAPPVLRNSTRKHTLAGKPDPEVTEPNTAATIWLHRPMPDPTPASKRLTKRFANRLVFAAHRHKVDWALMLGVLRARGYRGSVPATKVGLNRLATNLAKNGARKDQWSAVLAIEGRTAFADRTIALARYHRAVGLNALVRGLEWAKPMLAKRTLRDKRITVYGGGRNDLLQGRIDVRVIVLIRYLAEAHGQVTVSCLFSGHGLFSRPGVVSHHIYGLAVDIAALGGQSIYGHQQPGSVTEQAVRNMLLLPAEVRPVQVISLLGLGGPSFPLANHDDHIHAGF
ncbi:MAG TPA: hypothetical protein VFP24_07910 [Gaiellaceae bacterium]|nr:hypothetical protein [Gaiellaceae bacterium]